MPFLLSEECVLLSGVRTCGIYQLIDFLLTTRLGDNVTFTLFDGMSEREVTITVIAEMISVQ